MRPNVWFGEQLLSGGLQFRLGEARNADITKHVRVRTLATRLHRIVDETRRTAVNRQQVGAVERNKLERRSVDCRTVYRRVHESLELVGHLLRRGPCGCGTPWGGERELWWQIGRRSADRVHTVARQCAYNHEPVITVFTGHLCQIDVY